MAEKRSGGILIKLGVALVGILAIGAGGYVFARPMLLDDRGHARELLDTRYGRADAERRLAEFDAQAARKSIPGRELFWKRTRDELSTTPEERQAAANADLETARTNGNEYLRQSAKSYVLALMRPCDVLTLKLSDARKGLSSGFEANGQPSLEFNGRFANGVLVTASYGSADPTEVAGARRGRPKMIAAAGEATLPVRVSFSFDLIHCRTDAEAFRNLDIDTTGMQTKSDRYSPLLTLPRAPRLRHAQVSSAYRYVSRVDFQDEFAPFRSGSSSGGSVADPSTVSK